MLVKMLDAECVSKELCDNEISCIEKLSVHILRSALSGISFGKVTPF